MRVELLYFDGCPGSQELRPRVERLLAERGLGDALELALVTSVAQAEAQRFLGSPSLRVDRRDIEVAADERRDFGVKCRLYASEGGMGRAPSDELIAAALDRVG